MLGGIRSGKSAHAESLLTGPTPARYIATAQAPATGDPEWAGRIEQHRRRRPATWTTVETSDVATALRTDTTATLIDDLGGWVSAIFDAAGAWEDDAFDFDRHIAELSSAVGEFDGDLVIVSAEVGLSLVAPTPAGRRFQDALGAANQAIAAVCDQVILVVAGRPMTIGSSSVGAEPTTAAADSATTSAAAVVGAATDAAAVTAASRTADDISDAEQFDPIPAPDQSVLAAARERQLQLTKPPGALGRLEDIANWIASCQGVCPPQQFERPTVVVFAGDHGVAASGVSAFPPEVTAQMVANFANGGAAVNVLARRAGAVVRVEDISVAADTDPALSRYKIRKSSGNLAVEDALTKEEALRAIAAGRAIADEQIDSGADLLIAGEMGIGNTTPAAIIIGLITNNEPVVVVGRGTGIDDAGWARKTAAVRDGMRRARPTYRIPTQLLQRVGGADIAAMAGFLAQASLRRTPVILDGVVVTAAALIAQELAPNASRWWLAGHRSAEPAHAMALRYLDLEPVLEMSMRLGEGSGALAALPIVQAAVATLGEMATFGDAGVSDAAPLSED